jgi:site-specific DNA recombinase
LIVIGRAGLSPLRRPGQLNEDDTMTKRAILYARVSTDDQRGNYSIPTQVDECLQYIKKKGYSLVGNHYIDPATGRDVTTADGIRAFVDDYSSREISRPGLNAALDYLESVGFDIVVVHALDRLARDPYVRQTLEMEFNRHDARVEYVLGNYEETPEGEVRKDLDATFAKWENARRVERSKRGKRGKAESGLFVGGRPPFGYRIDRQADGGLAIDDEQAAVVQRIFNLYVHDRQSIRGIVNILTAEEVKNQSGKDHLGQVICRPCSGEYHL